jgi:hypothetical protein
MPLTSTVPADAVQVTPGFPFVTFAVNETVWPVPVAAVCGLTLTLTGEVTVNVAEAPGVPAAVAVIEVVPAPTLVARPPATMVATEVFEEAQVTRLVPSWTLPLL